MKRKTMLSSIFIVLLIFGFNLLAEAGVKVRSAGIGFRGSYWKSNMSQSDFFIRNNQFSSEVNVGGGGGWIYFFSRIDNEWIFEFSLGAIGEADVKESHYQGDDVKVDGIIPVLFGLKHELFSVRSQSALRPYIAFGGGPYWLSDIHVKEEYFGEDEVNIKSKLKPGGYGGAGMNFMFSSWFGLNFDAKYHFVDFNVNHDYSGWEYGFGFFFTWGRYRPSRG